MKDSLAQRIRRLNDSNGRSLWDEKTSEREAIANIRNIDFSDANDCRRFEKLTLD